MPARTRLRTPRTVPRPLRMVASGGTEKSRRPAKLSSSAGSAGGIGSPSFRWKSKPWSGATSSALCRLTIGSSGGGADSTPSLLATDRAGTRCRCVHVSSSNVTVWRTRGGQGELTLISLMPLLGSPSDSEEEARCWDGGDTEPDSDVARWRSANGPSPDSETARPGRDSPRSSPRSPRRAAGELTAESDVPHSESWLMSLAESSRHTPTSVELPSLACDPPSVDREDVTCCSSSPKKYDRPGGATLGPTPTGF